MFPSGVDLKLKRPKAASLAKKDDTCIPLTLVCVCVCQCVCSCLPLGVDQGFNAGYFLQWLSTEPGSTNFSGLACTQASGIVL